MTLSAECAIIARIGETFAARCPTCGWVGDEFDGLTDYDGMAVSIATVDEHQRAEHLTKEADDRGE